MANMPSVDIADMLVDDSVGVLGTNIFIGKEPNQESLVLTAPIIILYDVGGAPPEATVGANFEKPTVTVHVRGTDGGYVAAATKIQAVAKALHLRDPETKGSTRYAGIWQEGSINLVGYDERNRPLFSTSFRIHRMPT